MPDYQEWDKSFRMFYNFWRGAGSASFQRLLRRYFFVPLMILLAWWLGPAIIFAATPFFHSELIFPPQVKHVHSSCIVECPNGDLLATWFHGSGEKESPDVKIQGARLRKEAAAWSEVFTMADTPNLPDCNPVLFIDAKQELTLFWIAVLGESWNNCLLRFRKSKDYLGDGPPKWHWQDDLILTPGPEFVAALQEGLPQLSIAAADYGGHVKPPGEVLIEAARDPGKRQLGWMPAAFTSSP